MSAASHPDGAVSNPGSGDGSPSLRSTGSSAPPAAQGHHITADQLQHTHPLWQRAAGHAPPTQVGGAGRGTTNNARGRGAAGGGGSQHGDGPRFEPLSALALELESFRKNADGDSALFSEDSENRSRAAGAAKRPRARQQQQQQRRPPAQEDADTGNDSNGDQDDGFSALVDSGDDCDADSAPSAARRQKRKASTRRGGGGGGGGGAASSADAAMYARAAFGGCYSGGAGDVSEDESASQMSTTSSQMRKAAYKAAFPVRGVDCVGCALVKKIAPVEKFLRDNLEKMAEESLWKMAALTYVKEVQEPRRREGVMSPDVRRAFAHSHTRTRLVLTHLSVCLCVCVAVGLEGPALPLSLALHGVAPAAHADGACAADHALRGRATSHARRQRRAGARQGFV